MKDSFVLPEKWCVKSNKDIVKIIAEFWDKSLFLNKIYTHKDNIVNYQDHYWYSHNLSSGEPFGKTGGSNHVSKDKVRTEITFDEFKKYVLKMSTDNRFPFKLSYEDATSIVDAACWTWQDKLSKLWGAELLKNKYVSITESFYTEMRGACTKDQNILFDKIFGVDTIECPYKEGEWIAVSKDSTNWGIKECLGEMSGKYVKTVVNPGECGVWAYHMSLTDFNNKFNANTTTIKVGDYVRIKDGCEGKNYSAFWINGHAPNIGHWNSLHRVFLVKELGIHYDEGIDLVYGTTPDQEVCFNLDAVEKVSAAEYNKQI